MESAFQDSSDIPSLTAEERAARSASVWLGGLAMLRYQNATLKMMEQGVWELEGIIVTKYRDPVESAEGDIRFSKNVMFSVTHLKLSAEGMRCVSD